jgi:hypothetical protein
LRNISAKELQEIIEEHQKHLSAEGGQRANLRYADLRGADLRGADLRYANLRGADLRDANLRYADLRGADLRYADLRGADLIDADLRDANLRDANLRYADLRGADLRYAKDISELAQAKLMMCPEFGEFIGFKKCRNNTIVTLRIPEDAKRSSATSRKCRCSKAVVVRIEDSEGNDIKSTYSQHDCNFEYIVGQTVTPDEFDDNRWNECSSGIHFFITKQEAIEY